MGRRKANAILVAKARKIAKVKRDANKVKRAGKAKTPGQKLHDTMHGKTKK